MYYTRWTAFSSYTISHERKFPRLLLVSLFFQSFFFRLFAWFFFFRCLFYATDFSWLVVCLEITATYTWARKAIPCKGCKQKYHVIILQIKLNAALHSQRNFSAGKLRSPKKIEAEMRQVKANTHLHKIGAEKQKAPYITNSYDSHRKSHIHIKSCFMKDTPSCALPGRHFQNANGTFVERAMWRYACTL